MGIMLIIANIVIAKIKDNREDKKIELQLYIFRKRVILSFFFYDENIELSLYI